MKALRTAAVVVGGVALIASGIGAAAGVGAFGAYTAGSTTAATLATVATAGKIATIAAAGLTLATSVAAPKGTLAGSPQKFTIDKESGIPIVFGRTLSGGRVVHRQDYAAKRQRESWVIVRSLGPVKSMEPLQISKRLTYFDAGGQATGFYRGNAWMDEQLGAVPEARALRGPTGDFPGWNASSKLSGLAADLVTLDFDTKNEKFPNGVPALERVVEGVFAWDPRLDDTFPGGMGPCRLDDPSTHIWTECPWLLGLQFALGFYHRGMLVAGGGLKVRGVDVDSFVEAANIADANGWKAGGLVFSAVDNDWDILKMLCQAGGGEPSTVGGILSCTFSAPRISIGTITAEDIAGEIDAPSTASRRLRRNTIIPKVRLESHGWEMTPLAAVKVDEYIAIDGGPRPREIDFPLVQQADQGAELAMYAMLDARELDPIVLPCKVYMLGYRPNDCLTLDLPEANLVDRDVILRTRELDGGSFGVTFGCRSETPGKHDFALGRTGTPPPTPDLVATPIDRDAPDAGEWILVGETLSAGGVSIPALVVRGAVANPAAEAVVFEYRVAVDGQAADAGWISAGTDVPTLARKELTGVTPGTAYEVSVRYRVRGLLTTRLLLGPATSGDLSTQARGARQISRRTVTFPTSSTADSISIAGFTGVLDGRTIDFPATTITGLPASTVFALFYDLAAQSWEAVPSPALDYHASSAFTFLGEQATSNGEGLYSEREPAPGGWGGFGYMAEAYS